MASFQEQLATYQPDPATFLRKDVHTFPVNEGRHRDQILAEVKRDYAALPRERDYARVHLGFAGFFNFDVAALGHYDGMVLCDLNQDQIRFWNKVIELLAQYENPGAFRKAFAKCYEKIEHEGNTRSDHYFHVDDVGGRVQLRFQSSDKMFSFSANTFLSDQEWIKDAKMYRHLHDMAKAGNIAAVPLDAHSKEQCSALGDAIAAANINSKPVKLDSIYASNIYDGAMLQTNREALNFHFSDFIKIAKDMEKNGVDLHADSITRGSNRFDVLRRRFEYALGTGIYRPEEAHEKQALHDAMVPITEAFLDVYRELTPQQIRSIRFGALGGVDSEHRKGRNLHSDVADILMNRLLSHPDMDQDYIGKRYQTTTPQHHYAEQRHIKADYSVLRSLATDADTKIYCTSTFHRPLVKFAGPDSERSTLDWSEAITQESRQPAKQER